MVPCGDEGDSDSGGLLGSHCLHRIFPTVAVACICCVIAWVLGDAVGAVLRSSIFAPEEIMRDKSEVVELVELGQASDIGEILTVGTDH